MYIDLIILLILLILVIIFCKKLQFSIFYFVTVDLILRVLAFIKNNLGLKDLSRTIGKYLPESVFDIINRYTSNGSFFNMALKWSFVVIMIFFLVYIVKIFIKKRKI